MITNKKNTLFQPGHLLVFRWDGFATNVISKGKGDYWTHIGVITKVEGPNVYVQEALNKPKNRKVKTSPYSKDHLLKLHAENKVGVLRPKFQYDPERIENIAKKYEGMPYDNIAILQIAAYEIFGWFGMTPPFKYESKELLICSEHASRFMYDLSNKRCILGIDTEMEGKLIPDEYDPDKAHDQLMNAEYKKSYDRIRPQDIFLSKHFEVYKFSPFLQNY